MDNPNGSTGGPGQAANPFIFDGGVGVVTNYKAMPIGYGRMDKIVVTHLHADHMNDLSTIYPQVSYLLPQGSNVYWSRYVHAPADVVRPSFSPERKEDPNEGHETV